MSEEQKETGRSVCAVERFEGATAVLRTEAKEEITVPRRLLPQGTSEGATVVADFQTPDKMGDQNQVIAKNVLNELFGHPAQ